MFYPWICVETVTKESTAWEWGKVMIFSVLLLYYIFNRERRTISGPVCTIEILH